jgi:hypothetical protein
MLDTGCWILVLDNSGLFIHRAVGARRDLL